MILFGVNRSDPSGEVEFNGSTAVSCLLGEILGGGALTGFELANQLVEA